MLIRFDARRFGGNIDHMNGPLAGLEREDAT
jgi:hypothetical protein